MEKRTGSTAQDLVEARAALAKAIDTIKAQDARIKALEGGSKAKVDKGARAVDRLAHLSDAKTCTCSVCVKGNATGKVFKSWRGTIYHTLGLPSDGLPKDVKPKSLADVKAYVTKALGGK